MQPDTARQRWQRQLWKSAQRSPYSLTSQGEAPISIPYITSADNLRLLELLPSSYKVNYHVKQLFVKGCGVLAPKYSRARGYIYGIGFWLFLLRWREIPPSAGWCNADGCTQALLKVETDGEWWLTALRDRFERGWQQQAWQNQCSQISETDVAQTHSFAAACKPLPRTNVCKVMCYKVGYIWYLQL